MEGGLPDVLMQRHDKDADGYITRKEWKTPKGRRQRTHPSERRTQYHKHMKKPEKPAPAAKGNIKTEL